jgi:hypothetical protein
VSSPCSQAASICAVKAVAGGVDVGLAVAVVGEGTGTGGDGLIAPCVVLVAARGCVPVRVHIPFYVNKIYIKPSSSNHHLHKKMACISE